MLSPQITYALEKFGLSEKEILTYTTILKLGKTSPFALSRETKIPRTTIYDLLMQLSLKGLIELEQSDGMSKQQTKIQAKNPSVIRHILKERQQELIKTEFDVLSILPMLKNDFQGVEGTADFQMYPGLEGAKKVYFHAYDPRLLRIVWENMMPMDAFGMQETNEYALKETQSNISSGADHREIIPLTEWTKHVLTYQVGIDAKYITGRNIRYIENPLFNCNLSIVIQGERLYITCAHEDELWGMIIKSNTLSAFLTSLFELEWQHAKPVTHDVVKSWGKNKFL